jgi:hypothetical protein
VLYSCLKKVGGKLSGYVFASIVGSKSKYLVNTGFLKKRMKKFEALKGIRFHRVESNCF